MYSFKRDAITSTSFGAGEPDKPAELESGPLVALGAVDEFDAKTRTGARAGEPPAEYPAENKSLFSI